MDHNGIIRYRYAGPIDQTVWTQTLYPMIQQLQAEAKVDGAS
jgi:cytochrome c biogenesis protein CcmG/thiol:disulfide interchange protein DsbE